MTIWRTFVAWLASLAADPAEIDREPPRAAAAVAAAYATFAPDAPAPPAPPSPKACPCGGTCKGTGIYRPDGRIEMKCQQECKTCAKSVLSPVRTPCPDGTCPPR